MIFLSKIWATPCRAGEELLLRRTLEAWSCLFSLHLAHKIIYLQKHGQKRTFFAKTTPGTNILRKASEFSLFAKMKKVDVVSTQMRYQLPLS
jgi:hypothetical protein